MPEMFYFNKANYDIDLTDWTIVAADGTPAIDLTATIPAGGYFLLERTNDQTISNIARDQIYTGALVNGGENLSLKDSNGDIIDQLDCSEGWYAGQNKKEEGIWIRKTM